MAVSLSEAEAVTLSEAVLSVFYYGLRECRECASLNFAQFHLVVIPNFANAKNEGPRRDKSVWTSYSIINLHYYMHTIYTVYVYIIYTHHMYTCITTSLKHMHV